MPATGFTRVELGGDADELRAWIGIEVDALELVGGAPGVRSATIATAEGDVVLAEHL